NCHYVSKFFYYTQLHVDKTIPTLHQPFVSSSRGGIYCNFSILCNRMMNGDNQGIAHGLQIQKAVSQTLVIMYHIVSGLIFFKILCHPTSKTIRLFKTSRKLAPPLIDIGK